MYTQVLVNKDNIIVIYTSDQTAWTWNFLAYFPLRRQQGPWEQVPGLCVSTCAETPPISSGEPISEGVSGQAVVLV